MGEDNSGLCKLVRVIIFFFCEPKTYYSGSNSKGFIFYSGAPAARRAAKLSPIVITGKKRKPMKDFLMVIMASGIARGRVRTTTTTTTESRNMAAILQKIG